MLNLNSFKNPTSHSNVNIQHKIAKKSTSLGQQGGNCLVLHFKLQLGVFYKCVCLEKTSNHYFFSVF